MTHTITLRKVEPVTHDVRRFIFDRPADYRFTPGHACHVSLHRNGWRDAAQPFSFTSLPEDDHLEFTIKSYPPDAGRGGFTAEIATLEPGESVSIDEPFGAIEDKGPGVFIAGGAGVTPFIPILRRRARDGEGITACTLIFSNRTERDIILRDEWDAMDGLNCFYVVTRDPDSELPRGRIDAEFLGKMLKGFRETFYVCGPRQMTRDVMDALKPHRVPEENIVQDQW